LVGAHLVLSLQTIVSRNIDPLHSATVTIGVFNSGYIENAIADESNLSGTIRYYTDEVKEIIYDRFGSIIDGTRKMFDVDITVAKTQGYPATINHKESVDKIMKCISSVASAGEPYRTMGAEDFSYYLLRRPGCIFFVGSSKTPVQEKMIPHHRSDFDFDEEALLISATCFLRIIDTLLCNKPKL